MADAPADCVMMVRARLLAEWVGAGGRPVTAKDVLRPVDIPLAAAALNVQVPARTRTAADVEVLHRPWTAARGAGFITVAGGRATLVGGPGRDPLDQWWGALLAVLEAESHDPRHEGAGVLCAALLTVLTDPTGAAELDDRVHDLLEEGSSRRLGAVYKAFRRGVLPVEAGLELLVEFGAVDAAGRITQLGRWAGDRFAATMPQPVQPDLPAADLLVRLAELPEDDAWREGHRWLSGQDDDAAAAADLLAAAQATGPAARFEAFDLVAAIGEPALPALRAALRQPMLAVHARAVLADGELSEADRCWLTVEHALAEDDPEEVYHLVQECGGAAAVEASDHPDRHRLLEALEAFGRPVIPVYRLKIALTRYHPPVWRRLLVPGPTPLDVLHDAIQTAFDWDDDHLHLFDVGGRQYSDPYCNVEEADDTSRTRLAKVLTRVGATMTYVYDFGDCWEHKITVEAINDHDDRGGIVCTDGAGDAPVEDWNEEAGPDTIPFDLDTINRRLAQLTATA